MPQFFEQPSDYKKITEVAYLNADMNHLRYRLIMRYFFVQHERMRDFIYPEDILSFIQSEYLPAYTSDQLTQDLKQLVTWQNISESYEVKNPRTIAEFNRRNSRYQILPISVEVERMMRVLERQGDSFKGSLDVRLFEKLYRSLQDFIMLNKTDQQLLDSWEEVVRRFKLVRETTADYMAYLSSEDAIFSSQKIKLLEFKEKFIRYLRDFILGSHQMAAKISDLLIQEETIQKCLLQLSYVPEFVPRFEVDVQQPEEKLVETEEIFQSIKNWFIDQPQHLSEYSLLNQRTDEMIRKITRAIRDIGEERSQRSSRKKDYLHMAKWFYQCEDIAEAHCLSARVFGVESARYYWVEEITTSDIYGDIWQQEPSVYYLRVRVREYREATKNKSFTLNQAEKEKLMREYQSQQEKVLHLLKTFIHQGEIHPSTHEFIPKEIRRLFLKWFAQGVLSNEGVFSTEFGQRMKLLRIGGIVELRSDDGILEMEDFKFSIITRGEVNEV
ncbi:TIGR02677 family protein [Enterococcus mundtii]|uniref:TIGR02677 family protein n=1 Tax=Enterococcus mundtii TaxID=53346 RepID=UPI00189C0D5E|nr:TIGR02677 family protein [Enterococcus mundtii]